MCHMPLCLDSLRHAGYGEEKINLLTLWECLRRPDQDAADAYIFRLAFDQRLSRLAVQKYI